MLFCRLLIFSNSILFFQEYHQSVKQFGFRSGPKFCRPDLDPNCLQMLSANDTSRQGAKCQMVVLDSVVVKTQIIIPAQLGLML